MPKMNGFEFIEALIALTQLSSDCDSPEIVLMSTSNSPLDHAKISAFPCIKQYLQKGEYSLQVLEKLVAQPTEADC